MPGKLLPGCRCSRSGTRPTGSVNDCVKQIQRLRHHQQQQLHRGLCYRYTLIDGCGGRDVLRCPAVATTRLGRVSFGQTSVRSKYQLNGSDSRFRQQRRHYYRTTSISEQSGRHRLQLSRPNSVS